MNHYEITDWQDYIQGSLDIETQNNMEQHLYSCDVCLKSYMEAMEQASRPLPVPISSEGYADQIMNVITGSDNVKDQIKIDMHPDITTPSRKELHPDIVTPSVEETQVQSNRQEAKVLWYQRTLVQYAVAASITLALMTGGAFQSISQQVDKLQVEVIQERESSVSERLMEKTLSFIDEMHSKSWKEAPTPHE